LLTKTKIEVFPLDAFSPRIVQARVRAGTSPEVVAAETGWPLDKVLRYADPPIGERAFVAEQAQAVVLHGGADGTRLIDVANEVITALDLQALEWDAWREEDGRWFVTARSGDRTATWTYDHSGRNLHPQDTFARVLMGVDESSPSAHPSQRVVEERPHLVAVRDEAAVPTDARVDTITLPIPEPEVVEPAPTPKRRSRSKRASVPSWDEILFGTQRETDEL
jgi:hypothetical protein